MTAFDRAIALAVQPDGSFTGHTSPDYANMVGPFGGITAAQAINAVLQHPQRLGDPVAFTVNFCAAMADGPFTAAARPLRTNRSTQHWLVELQQGGATVVSATAVTALRRDTWGVDEHARPAAPAPDQVPQAQGGMVEWIHRYEMRFLEGGMPPAWDGSDQGSSRSLLWVRDAPPRPLDFASLTALCDVFFPRVWRRRRSRVPIGTVSMTLYFHADAQALAHTGSGHLLSQAHAHSFRRGFFDQTALLWNEAGLLLASAHQVVYYKA
jgi:acyl-CoA thioesterase